MNITPLNLLTTVVFGAVVYKSLKGWLALEKLADEALDPVITGIAEAYVEHNNPLVRPQIKFKSKYFNDYVLTPEALKVIKKFDKIFNRAFMPDGQIKAEFIHIIDDGVFYSETNLPQPTEYNRGYNVTSF